jgi:hypothetical protein
MMKDEVMRFIPEDLIVHDQENVDLYIHSPIRLHGVLLS